MPAKNAEKMTLKSESRTQVPQKEKKSNAKLKT